jgi:S1-C subfamily serine protease
VRVTVLRKEGRKALGVRLMAMPSGVAGERIAAEFGFVLREADGTTGEGVRLMAGPPAVSFVGKGGSADKAGLEVGDVIVQVNEHAVLTRDATREALSDVPLERPLRLTVRRGEERVPLTLAPPESRP